MTKFLHYENMKILWEVMMTTPFFVSNFSDDKLRKHWFESILYRFNENESDSVEKLNVLNHKVVKCMMDELSLNNSINIKILNKNKNQNNLVEKLEPTKNINELMKLHIDERNLIYEQLPSSNNTLSIYEENKDIDDSNTDFSTKKVTFSDNNEIDNNFQKQIILLQDNFQKQIILLQDNFQKQISLMKL